METLIYWFSATGNSLMAARQIKDILGKADLVPISQARGDEGLKYQCIFLVFPLYYLGMPALVSTFINKLLLAEGSKVIAVISRGSTGMGGVCHVLRKRLAKNGISLDASVYLDMPNNDCTLFSVAEDKKNQRRLAKAERQLKLFMDIIQGGKTTHPWEFLGFLHNFRQQAYYQRILVAHQKFYTSPGCTSCGICSFSCSSRKILMDEGKPRWLAGCQECEACINLCPQQVIQYQGSKTEKKRRYKHPSITWKDLAQQQRK